ncbi:MAG: bifunctional methylenetetrahydrofolate dehydrogenase/methenyltetrahydrofolate cyclohydrolase FolD [Armatimonadetes bacterium]|nr:bifunctional methylenetetrahydrofolate dehydrogenase/methenyltetrahydrofolate cyclohydrolase FolD [Armatimonadota bacterium]MDE2206699.1 bifunctional methylenetetrahydrofolate dehydrogenase/methenyltetrahydrofolate cyclohydrolase FolD [Armatimonadota bacterium]
MSALNAQILDGSATAALIRAEVAESVVAFVANGLPPPHLAAVLIGEDPASHTYVSMKRRACRAVGMASSVHRLNATASQSQCEDLVSGLNANPDITGILVQHPLPKHLNEPAVLDLVSPGKDVDGIGRASLGALVNNEEGFECCTPAGIMELLRRYALPIEGKHAVVVGRSIIVGKPMALLLLNASATVTVCHSKTRDLASVTRTADILVAAVGRPELITGEMLKPGVIVADAGYNRVAGRTTDVGDVEFESASSVASFITPVPGGVGPMTIAMLLSNTLKAARRAAADKSGYL